jgi:glutamyl-Q tRNA(Asp) synthetase
MIVTRFAPSPTGPLHLGSAYAAWFAWNAAREAGGQFLLRIEDLDQTRARPEHEAAILDDLRWLGLDWDGPVVRQSERGAAYAAALDQLTRDGLTYPCFCTRREIRDEIANPGNAPHLPQHGPDGPLYPGTCRHIPQDEAAARIAHGETHALRLNTHAALARSGPLTWREAPGNAPAQTIHADPAQFGDIVLARKDAPAAYHLAVVVDDAASGITLVTRGADLKPATDIQTLLQHHLSLPHPTYRHHLLVRGEDGARLAKRAKSASIAARREAGETAEEVLGVARGRLG